MIGLVRDKSLAGSGLMRAGVELIDVGGEFSSLFGE